MEDFWTKVGVIAGILGTAVAIWSVVHDGESRATEELRRIRELQEELRREQAEREQRAIQDEMAKLTVERAKVIAPLARQHGENVFKISLRNRCKHAISVAISYKALDDQWVTEGWWNLKLGEKKTTGRVSRNSWLYFYAENVAEKLEWNGTGKTDKSEEMIVDDKFIRIGEGPLRGTNLKKVTFFGKNAGTEYGEHVETFTCD